MVFVLILYAMPIKGTHKIKSSQVAAGCNFSGHDNFQFLVVTRNDY